MCLNHKDVDFYAGTEMCTKKCNKFSIPVKKNTNSCLDIYTKIFHSITE